jgi:uncharacterized protein (TIGR02231 family)
VERILFEDTVSAVTMYTCGRARVTRTAALQLKEGRSVFGSYPLPSTADLQSVQVSFVGTREGLKIESVETRREPLDDKDWESKTTAHSRAIEQAEERLFEISQELYVVDSSIQCRHDTVGFLQQLRERAIDGAARQKVSKELALDSWAGAVDYVEQRAQRAHAEISELQMQRRRTAERHREEERKYRELQSKGPRQDSLARAYITVFSEKSQAAEVHVTYNVSDAHWEPSYRANVEGRELSLEMFASATQSTGENWAGVSLAFSTARPDIGTDIPVLQPWYIQVGALPQSGSACVSKSSFRASAAGADESGAAAGTSGSATVFSADSPAAIPSDSQEHRIPVTTIRSGIELEYVAIPKLIPHAFLLARMANPAAFPLLPGIVEVMVGNGYVGRGMMRLTAPGQKIELSLGVDERVKIALQLVDEKSERKWRGHRVQKKNVYRIKAANYVEEEISLSIYDQLPISKSSEIGVDYGREASKALRGAEFPGQLKWSVRLQKREVWQTEFDFTIEYPEAMKQQIEMDNRKIRYNWLRPQKAEKGGYEAVEFEGEMDQTLML